MRIRHVLLIAVASLVCAARAPAQNLDSMVRVSYSLDPAPRIKITNEGASPLLSLVVLLSYPYAPNQPRGVAWYDPAIYLMQEPHIAPGHSYLLKGGISTFVSDAPYVQPYVAAAEFEDGTAVGDPRWLTELHAPREAAYKEIDAISALLEQALGRHETDADILSALNVMRRTVSDDWHRDVRTREVETWVIDNVVRVLGLLPPDHRAVDLQTRIPSVVVPLLTRWRGTLKRYDPSVENE